MSCRVNGGRRSALFLIFTPSLLVLSYESMLLCVPLAPTSVAREAFREIGDNGLVALCRTVLGARSHCSQLRLPPPASPGSEPASDDYRLFVGDLGNEVTDDNLAGAFRKYSSFAKAKIIREKWNKKSKGYGFVSFLDG